MISNLRALAAIAIGLNGSPALGGDTSASEATIKEKGLTRAGHAYVLEAEAPVLAKMKDVKGLFARWGALVDKSAAADQDSALFAELGQEQTQLSQAVDNLNMQINNNNNNNGRTAAQVRTQYNQLVAQRDQYRTNHNALRLQMETIRQRMPDAKTKAGLESDAREKGDEFRKALGELRPKVDEVKAQYDGLAKDPAVKAAMDDLKKNKLAKLKLGPSDEFIIASRQLEQAERQFLAKPVSTPTRKKAKAKAKK